MNKTPPEKPERFYHAYLLRIWLEGDQSRPKAHSWRFSLEDAHTHTLQGFRDLDTLLVYLHNLTTHPPTMTPPGK